MAKLVVIASVAKQSLAVREIATSLSLLAMTLGLLLVPTANAAQYESTSRVVSGDIKEPPSIQEVAKNAEAELRKVKGNPYATSLLLQQLAAQAIKAEDNDKAIDYYQRLLKQKSLSGPALQPVRYNLSQLYYADGQYQKAIDLMKAYFKDGGGATAQAWVLLGSAYVQLKRFDLAKRPLQSAIEQIDGGKQQPEHEDWYRLLLAVYFNTKDHKAAEQLLQRMTRAYPDKLDYWQQLAGLQLKQKKRHSALATVEMAYRYGLLSEEADLQQFVSLFASAGAPFYGASLLQGWIEDGSLSAHAEQYVQLAALWQQAREQQKAAAALDQALAQKARGEWWLQLGQIRLDSRQWRQAEVALSTAIKLQGLGNNVDEAYLALGLARYQQRNFNAAREAFKQAGRFKNSKAVSQQWLKYLDDIESHGFFASKVAGKDGGVASGFAGNVAGLYQRGGIEVADSQLGSLRQNSSTLTPIGAEMAASGDGSIPAWDGGFDASTLSATHDANGALVNPFADEQPLFVITQDNMQDYAQWLSAGHQAMFKAYPSYQMPVYSSHRTVRYPQAIYDATLENEKTAKLVGSDSLVDARLGFPFRRPEHGAQVIWNHRVRYRGDSMAGRIASIAQRPSGGWLKVVSDVKVRFDYGNLESPGKAAGKNLLIYYFAQTLSPPQARGATVLAHDTIDVDQSARKIWGAGGGYKKVLRIPPIGYDFPNPGSEGLQFVDMIDMYNGAFDRYDWRLIGKREMFIPYNAYALNARDLSYDQILGPEFLNPQYTRYEKHRVWVVDAVKRSGTSHHFRKRRFYIDEDSWGIVMVDGFNATNRLWKFQEGHLLPQFDIQAATTMPEIVYDLAEKRYFVTKLHQEETVTEYNVPELKPGWFSPTKLKQRIK
jgi:tetratricopeptide (TPR) repeat protein